MFVLIYENVWNEMIITQERKQAPLGNLGLYLSKLYETYIVCFFNSPYIVLFMNNNFASSTQSVIIWCIIPWHNCFSYNVLLFEVGRPRGIGSLTSQSRISSVDAFLILNNWINLLSHEFYTPVFCFVVLCEVVLLQLIK